MTQLINKVTGIHDCSEGSKDEHSLLVLVGLHEGDAWCVNMQSHGDRKHTHFTDTDIKHTHTRTEHHTHTHRTSYTDTQTHTELHTHTHKTSYTYINSCM